MNRRSLLFQAALLMILSLFVLGMGGVGGPAQSPVESPFNAKIKDSSGSEVNITSVTFDGKTTFSAYMGKGRVQIPFENIARIEMKDGFTCVMLKRSGTICNLKTNGVSKIYGKMSYGIYQVPLKDVMSIELTKAKQ